MAVLELPKRPTIANPVLIRDKLEKVAREIDENIDMLYCVHGTISGSDGVPSEAVEALNTIHNRLRRLADTLFTLA